jgi:hypothetical protein
MFKGRDLQVLDVPSGQTEAEASMRFHLQSHPRDGSVVGQFDKEAIQPRDLWRRKTATLRADRSDPSLRNKRLLQDDNAN